MVLYSAVSSPLDRSKRFTPSTLYDDMVTTTASIVSKFKRASSVCSKTVRVLFMTAKNVILVSVSTTYYV